MIGLFKTQDFDAAIKKARFIRDRSEDAYSDTRKLTFSCNGGMYAQTKKDKEPVRLSLEAEQQICKILSVPKQWVKIKRDMKDATHLSESLNRHKDKFPSTGILIRYYNTKEGKIIRAVFPDNYVALDIYEALKAIKSTVLKSITGWPFILIGNHSLNCLGIYNSPKIGEKVKSLKKHTFLQGILPAFHIHTSENGFLSPGYELAIFRGICENTAVIMDERFKGMGFKRTEKEDGQLYARFKEGLVEFKKKSFPAFTNTVKSIERLNSVEVEKDRITDCCLQAGKQLGFAKKQAIDIAAGWKPEESNMFGLWNSITRRGDVLTKDGKFKEGTGLQRAAGRLMTFSEPKLKGLA